MKSKLYILANRWREKELKNIDSSRKNILRLFYIKISKISWSHLHSSPSFSLPTSLLHLLLPVFRSSSSLQIMVNVWFSFLPRIRTRRIRLVCFSIAMVTSSYVRACTRRGNDNHNFRHRWCSKGAGRSCGTLPAGTRESAAIQSPPYECKSMNLKKILSSFISSDFFFSE